MQELKNQLSLQAAQITQMTAEITRLNTTIGTLGPAATAMQNLADSITASQAKKVRPSLVDSRGLGRPQTFSNREEAHIVLQRCVPRM